MKLIKTNLKCPACGNSHIDYNNIDELDDIVGHHSLTRRFEFSCDECDAEIEGFALKLSVYKDEDFHEDLPAEAYNDILEVYDRYSKNLKI